MQDSLLFCSHSVAATFYLPGYCLYKVCVTNLFLCVTVHTMDVRDLLHNSLLQNPLQTSSFQPPQLLLCHLLTRTSTLGRSSGREVYSQEKLSVHVSSSPFTPPQQHRELFAYRSLVLILNSLQLTLRELSVWQPSLGVFHGEWVPKEKQLRRAPRSR